MKSVLMSIHPKWVYKIAKGEKTIEVRKSAPKEVPFKAYIYETYDKKYDDIGICWGNGKCFEHGCKKVIGEFICDKVDKYTFSYYEAEYRVTHIEQEMMCLNHPDLIRYGVGKTLYGWYISDLKIYDKPKELSEFYAIAESGSDCCCGCVWHETPLEEMPCRTCTGERKYLTRPPQSWKYVQEIKNG